MLLVWKKKDFALIDWCNFYTQKNDSQKKERVGVKLHNTRPFMQRKYWRVEMIETGFSVAEKWKQKTIAKEKK